MTKDELKTWARDLSCAKLAKTCSNDDAPCPRISTVSFNPCLIRNANHCNCDDVTPEMWENILNIHGNKDNESPLKKGEASCCKSCIYQLEDDDSITYCVCDKAKLTADDSCSCFRDNLSTWEKSPCNDCKNYACAVMAMPQIAFSGIGDVPEGFCLPRLRRGRIMLKALTVINGERQDQYGSPEDNFEKIAEYWRTYLGIKTLNASNVAMMMVLFKIAREGLGSGKNADNVLDICGYSALYSDIMYGYKTGRQ